MTSRKRKIEDALARIAAANGVKEMTMTQGKYVPLIGQIGSQFPATLPPDDYQFEFIFSVKLDYRDWQMVLTALAAAPSAPAERDALRYRWLKANHLQTGKDIWIRTGDDLEEAIDTAMGVSGEQNAEAQGEKLHVGPRTRPESVSSGQHEAVPLAATAPSTNAATHSEAGIAESQAPSIRDGDRGVAPTSSAPSAAPVHRPVEYDGAYKCIDCGAMWGALPGHPKEPAQCFTFTLKNLKAPDLDLKALDLALMIELRDLALRGLKEKK